MVGNMKKISLILILFILFSFVWLETPSVFAENKLVIPGINLQINSSDNPNDVALSVQLLVLLTVLSLAPSILILMTSFTRIIIVLAFVRNALATQQMPPNQILISLALFMTFFIMAPTFQTINQESIQPYLNGEITQNQALEKAINPIKQFMIKQTREKDLMLFLKYSQEGKIAKIDEIPLTALVPAFTISELKRAFQMGFLIFIPFLVIDMIVASILMSMGMMMLPPVMISLPFKILLFILVDGWYLVVKSLLESF